MRLLSWIFLPRAPLPNPLVEFFFLPLLSLPMLFFVFLYLFLSLYLHVLYCYLLSLYCLCVPFLVFIRSLLSCFFFGCIFLQSLFNVFFTFLLYCSDFTCPSVFVYCLFTFKLFVHFCVLFFVFPLALLTSLTGESAGESFLHSKPQLSPNLCVLAFICQNSGIYTDVTFGIVSSSNYIGHVASGL